ncbi:MAG TPA: hypothetical protein PLV59_00100 [Candidatus Dojkabacteria bacterium]|nr:hypothetical protein [Candidatus Dojkabacteria bacterium]
MRKYIWLVLLVVFVLIIALVGIYIYRNIGITEYNDIASQISNIKDKTERKKSEDLFVGDGIEGVLYTGVVSFVNTYGEGGVLVYRKDSFKYFQGFKDTVYTYQTICAGDPVQTIRLGKIPQVEKIVTNNVNKWADYVKVGDYIQIMEVDKESKEKEGNLREAWASDFVPFLIQDFSTLCGKN